MNKGLTKINRKRSVAERQREEEDSESDTDSEVYQSLTNITNTEDQRLALSNISHFSMQQQHRKMNAA